MLPMGLFKYKNYTCRIKNYPMSGYFRLSPILFTRLYLVLVLIGLCFSSHHTKAQKNTLDSLKQALDTLPKEDERYVHTLWEAMEIARQVDDDQARIYAHEAYQICEMNFPGLTGRAMTRMAEQLHLQSLPDSAEVWLDKYRSTYSGTQDSIALGRFYLIRGDIARRGYKLEESAAYFDTAKWVAGGFDNKRLLAKVFHWTGILYDIQAAHNAALDYYGQALKLYKTLPDSNGMASIYQNIGGIYSSDDGEEEDYTLFKQYRDSAIWIFERQGNINNLALTYGNMLYNIAYLNNDIESAEYYLNKLNEIEPYVDNINQLGNMANKRGFYYLAKGEYGSAINAAMKARAMAKQHKFGDNTLEFAYWIIQEAYERLGNYQDAYINLKEWNAYKDSINQVEEDKTFLELETKYETTQKEAENQRLQLANEQQATLNRLLGTGGGLLLAFLGTLGFFYYKQTKQKKIIETQSDQLQKLNNLKSEFFANISHELRTPLTLERGNIENVMLSGDRFSPDNDRRLKNAVRSNRQLSRMIDDLLDLSKLELGQYQLKTAPVALNKFVGRVVSSFESLADDRGVGLKFSTEMSEDISSELDTRQFEKVINNLFYNAFKFSPSGTTVLVRLSVQHGMALISVKDEGAGIPEADLTRIFDRFYRVRNQEAEGSGLGLAIAKEIVVMHGGSIAVSSIVDVGTEFLIRLPVVEAADETVEQDEPPAEEDVVDDKLRSFVSERPEVLVVEDNIEMQDYIKEILSRYFSVTVKANGRQCLEWLETRSPALIISDVMMPEMDGFELLEKLKRSPIYHRIPVILLTARSASDDSLRGLRLGVDDYITKPFDRDELQIKAVNLVNNLQRRVKWVKEMGGEGAPAGAEEATEEDEKVIATLESYIRGRITDQKIAVSDVAKAVSMSERQLYRKLATVNGMSPGELIIEVRLQYARMLLLQGGIVKLSQLAMEVGIGTPAYLSKMFYERFGKRPTEFIQ